MAPGIPANGIFIKTLRPFLPVIMNKWGKKKHLNIHFLFWKEVTETTMDYSASQIPPSEDHLYFDVEYPVEDPDLSGETAF
jgi:hypothetical protein